MDKPLLKKTPITKLKRIPKRGAFDEKTVYEILDSTPICHVGHNVDGHPVVTPTIHWRHQDRIYWHGSRLSRQILAAQDNQVCLTVTLLDGIVMARSGFHHSANYRSVMIFGTPSIVDDPGEKLAALRQLIEGMFPGRWDMLRAPSKKEMNATTVLSMPISQASAKVRTGPAIDAEEDLGLPIWAGVIPVTTTMGEPVVCEHNQPGVCEPDHVRRYTIR